MIDILANVGKKFRLRKAMNAGYSFKLVEGTLLELNEVVLESASATIIFRVSKSNDITKIEKELTDKQVDKTEKELDKRKKLFAKIIKIWEDTPEIFTKQDRWYSEDKPVYDCSTPDLMGNNYMNGFPTGCGSNTFYSKQWYENQLKDWDKVLAEEIKNAKRRSKSWVRDLLKDDIEVKYSKIEEFVELDGHVKTTRKPKSDIVIDGYALCRILCDDEQDIDEDFIQMLIDNGEDDETINTFKNLLGGCISYEHEGYHHNDGQICDYTVTISTKEGHDYHAFDSHCLMVGWRFKGPVTFE